MNAPFSIEQSGPAWTSPYTLTPSAVGTWLWEEPRIVGLEAETWRSLGDVARISLVGGLGWGQDELGWLLAERGFVLSDFLSGVNSELKVPTKGKESSVFKERDGRPAVYAAVSLRDTNEIGELRLGYFDNIGDQSTRGNWATRFGTAGVLLHPWSKLDVGFQVLAGEIETEVNRWDSRFHAWYPLVSLHHHGHRLSARYDNFDVDDEEHAAPFSGDHGQAVTVAYLYEFRLRHRVGVEYAHVDSEHAARTVDRNRTDDLVQLSYRYRY
jgi:hypothetical protein